MGGRWRLAVAVVGMACAALWARCEQTTLERVRAAGVLRCGVDAAEPEYTTADGHGSRAAFDRDLCRAVAVAVLGDGAKTAIKEYPDDVALMAALKAGDVDVAPTLPDDFTHSVGTALALTRPVLWDGVGFLVPAASGVIRARQLSGQKICFIAETTVEESVRSWFGREHLDFVPFPFQEEGEMQAALSTGNCASLAGERTHLAQTRAVFLKHGRRTRLLGESVSNDPLALAVRDNDREWLAMVSWVMEALAGAEESGITQANARGLGANAAMEGDAGRRFWLGGSKEVGRGLGLDDGWVVRVISAVGNYGEIYERDLGGASVMNLPRGENRLRRDGGGLVALH